MCEFVENPLILRTMKEEMGLQVAMAKASGLDLTPSQRRKVESHTQSRMTHGFIGDGVHRQPSQCTMDTVRGMRVSSSGSYVGFHDTAAGGGDSS
jgi:hypothetical protein